MPLHTQKIHCSCFFLGWIFFHFFYRRRHTKFVQKFLLFIIEFSLVHFQNIILGISIATKTIRSSTKQHELRDRNHVDPSVVSFVQLKSLPSIYMRCCVCMFFVSPVAGRFSTSTHAPRLRILIFSRDSIDFLWVVLLHFFFFHEYKSN